MQNFASCFFELINEMVCKFNNSKESSKFNPVHMKHDEHPGSQIATKKSWEEIFTKNIPHLVNTTLTKV